MSEDRPDHAGADPEQRAFTGASDMPPKQPDQAAEENGELLRPEEGAEAPENSSDSAPNPHGDYTNLPGYGG